MWMFGRRRNEAPVTKLVPFVLRLREAHLIGVAHEPGEGAPCVSCVQKWLLERQIVSTPVDPQDFRLRRDLLTSLGQTADPHTFYEIAVDGSATKLENCVLPHPDCICKKEAFELPPDFSWNRSFAFSPISQIKCVRYTTPSGHIWLTSAVGKSYRSCEVIRTFGSGNTKEDSRRDAIVKWLKQASLRDFQTQYRKETSISAESLQTTNEVSIRLHDDSVLSVGAGSDVTESTLDGLYELARKRTLRRYAATVKNPILIVGTHQWLKSRMPFFLLQEYDWYLLFYPNSAPCWVVGAVGFSRLHSDAKPLFVFNSHSNMATALDGLVGKALELCRPDFEGGIKSSVAPISDQESREKEKQRNLWWTHWIYRCSKVNMKDVLGMESYPEDLELWRNYFRDGQPMVSLVPLNASAYPPKLAQLVQLRLHEPRPATGRVIGIGTQADFDSGIL